MLPTTRSDRLRLRAQLGISMLCLAFAAATHAQDNASAANSAEPAKIVGKTIQQRPFSLVERRAMVTLVMVWRADCFDCVITILDLRDNLRGWAQRPFGVVLVNLDKRREDAEGLAKSIDRSARSDPRLVQLWAHEAGYEDNLTLRKQSVLPVFYVVDKAGKVTARHHGKLTPEVWERIAFLL